MLAITGFLERIEHHDGKEIWDGYRFDATIFKLSKSVSHGERVAPVDRQGTVGNCSDSPEVGGRHASWNAIDGIIAYFPWCVLHPERGRWDTTHLDTSLELRHLLEEDCKSWPIVVSTESTDLWRVIGVIMPWYFFVICLSFRSVPKGGTEIFGLLGSCRQQKPLLDGGIWPITGWIILRTHQIDLYCLSFLDTMVAQVIENFPRGRQGPAYSWWWISRLPIVSPDKDSGKGLYSINGQRSYRKNSRSLETATFGFKLF